MLVFKRAFFIFPIHIKILLLLRFLWLLNWREFILRK